MPRGNTLDHRYTGPAIYGGSAQQQVLNQVQNSIPLSNDTTNVAASHSTTVGVSSQNGSRPGSAVKKGASPNNPNAFKVSQDQQSLDQYKNLMVYNSKGSNQNVTQSQQLKRSQIQGKSREVVNQHKKTSSVSTVKYSVAAASSRSKPKNTKPQKANQLIDYNSVALDQILQQ